MVLAEVGIAPRDVRLLRHQTVGPNRRTPYALWRDNREAFERYQSFQDPRQRAKFSSPYWASFVVPPDRSALFVGLYEVGTPTLEIPEWTNPLSNMAITSIERPQKDIYPFQRSILMGEYIGRLKVDWGKGMLAWVQRADGPAGDKSIIELAQQFHEPDFPGYTRFVSNLAALPNLPHSWTSALAVARGVYLLTCPRTMEHYVGSASGIDGFWGRWMNYVDTGHGGNEGLKSREPSDYQLSILEVAGSSASTTDIQGMEQLWKTKLQSIIMGLNRN